MPALTPGTCCSCVQHVIDCGALSCFRTLLVGDHKKAIKKEACWAISNITAGTK